MNFSPTWCLLLVCARASLAREWAWPDGQESVRIDTKVRFLDDAASDNSKRGNVQSDEAPFRQPTTTDGFYNRPPGAGRFPVRVVDDQRNAYRVNSEAVYRVQSNNEGNVDSVQFCKCVSTPECNPRRDSAEVCGVGKYLCCYKRPNRAQSANSEFFNEIEDERPMLFPGKERLGGPFPPPPNQAQGAVVTNYNSEYFDFGAVDNRQHNKPVIVGPGGPTGNIGPPQQNQVLVGPGGPTGNIGPPQNQYLAGPKGPTGNLRPSQQQVLVGPGGPTGVIGPAPTHHSGDRGVLVGPSGPTGVIGPAQTNQNLVASAAAQRGVLVGPGGPTGIIGPYGNRAVLTGPRGPTGVVGPNRNRGVLVGPGGPTGIIGPNYGGFGRQSGPGILVGPGGPTGSIGPGRQLLVGPGGPTGRIGPQRYFGVPPLPPPPPPPCTREPSLSVPAAVTPGTTSKPTPPTPPTPFTANCSRACAAAAPAAAAIPPKSCLHTSKKATESGLLSNPHADRDLHTKRTKSDANRVLNPAEAAGQPPAPPCRRQRPRPRPRPRQHDAWESKSIPENNRNPNPPPTPHS